MLPGHSIALPDVSRRPVPPALSMSDSSLSSTPLATPPPYNRASVLSSLASHVKSFVRVPAMKPRINTVDNFHCHARSTSPSFDSAVEDDESPTDSSFEDTEDLWWVTESDTSSTSSVALKKSSAQSIIPIAYVFLIDGILPFRIFSCLKKADYYTTTPPPFLSRLLLSSLLFFSHHHYFLSHVLYYLAIPS
ncbi:hypothetical protein BT96DRAFT_649369 [Gymnopus androsaceus JB14]|uniref:Uncharacterized protein n=1 Tax=Gymnopus androsaceus JB14 TaxID=1447944 RepID=A0A6A4HRJ1_9AGAR|nr:hypothetical protein BT96DRAFT_649369 [Gymnopus androsaceus JB14]